SCQGRLGQVIRPVETVQSTNRSLYTMARQPDERRPSYQSMPHGQDAAPNSFERDAAPLTCLRLSERIRNRGTTVLRAWSQFLCSARQMLIAGPLFGSGHFGRT